MSSPNDLERTDVGQDLAKAEPIENWSDLEQLLHRLVQDTKAPERPAQLELVGDIFRTAVKLAQDSPGTLNLKIAATTLRELRFSFKTFNAHKDKQKITMFGSARVAESDKVYDLARDFAAQSVKRGYMIITGGGPGVMAAGNEGAEKQGGFGLNIRLPFEQSANPFIDPKGRLINYKYFFTRKLFLVKEAAAVTLFPGGFGTFDEAFELLTLLQTGKTNLIPVILVEPKGYGFWEGFCDFIDKTVIGRGFASPADKVLYKVVHSPDEALDEVDRFYSTYHSMRTVKKLTVLRLKRKLSDSELKKLNAEFKNLAPDGFVQSSPLPEESNEPEIAALQRLSFPFDRKDMGSLRRLVDALNDKKFQ